MNDVLIRLCFVAHIAATLFMTGLIWFVQLVHYPLFSGVGNAGFPIYERRHAALTTWVVGPPMLVEGVTALLVLRFRPAGVTGAPLWAGIALLAVIWISTAMVQVPCHRLLAHGFDMAVHRRLVWTNWLRTVAWSLRALLVLWLVWAVMRVR